MATDRSAYYAQRYRQNRPRILAKMREYQDRPEIKERKKAYDKVWHANRLANPETREARHRYQIEHYRIKTYGTAHPEKGQLSLDGTKRYGFHGWASPKFDHLREERTRRTHRKKDRPVTEQRQKVVVVAPQPPPAPPATPEPPREPWIPRPEGVEVVPVPTGKVTYLCTYCSKPFDDQPTMRLHEAAHDRRVR